MPVSAGKKTKKRIVKEVLTVRPIMQDLLGGWTGKNPKNKKKKCQEKITKAITEFCVTLPIKWLENSILAAQDNKQVCKDYSQ